MSYNLYHALKTPRSTRLLKLHLDTPSTDTNLHAELLEVNIDEKPQYDAISYTWGDDTRTVPVIINDMPVNVKEGLYDFLSQLRRHRHTAPIWVDAISIRQDDLAEKGQQVAMIGDIFRFATTILVWVGEHSDDSQSLFQPWQCPPGVCPIPPPQFKSPVWSFLWGLYPKCGGATITPADQAHRFSVWLAFLRRPYWRRLWIVQELILASSIVVHCGDSRATWKELINSRTHMWVNLIWDGIELDALPRHSELPDTQRNLPNAIEEFRARLRDILQVDAMRHQRGPKGNSFIVHRRHAANTNYEDTTTQEEASDIGHLNALLHNFRCADRKDYVYGLLALEKSNEFRERLRLDYEIDEAELFVRMCLARMATWRGPWAWAENFVGLPPNWNPDGKMMEFIETMEDVLLDDRDIFMRAVELCRSEGPKTGSLLKDRQERRNRSEILTILKRSRRLDEFDIQCMALPEKESRRMDTILKEHKQWRKFRAKRGLFTLVEIS